MRIAVFIKSTTFNKGFGGLETQNKLLCEGLAGAGNEVVVIAPAPHSHSGAPLRQGYGGAIESPSPNPKSEYRNLKPICETWGGELSKDTKYQILNTKYLKYVFVKATPGKYSKQWFRESLKVFQKLHQESPFDMVISQSMAGQKILAHRKEFKRSRAYPSSESCRSGRVEKLTGSEVLDAPSGLARTVKERFVPIVVIQHGTILGELKTRWRSLRVNPKSEYRNSKQIRNPNVPNSKPFGISDFGHWDLFRISDFVLRIFGVARDFLHFFFRLVPYCIKIYFLDQLRLRRADRVIAVSDQVRSALIGEYFLPPEKVEVVYNGVEIGKYGIPRYRNTEIRKELGIGREDKVILYVGRIEREKGLAHLLEAVLPVTSYQLPVTLLIVGNGPYLADLKGLAERLGIADRVIFTGKVPYEDVPKYYAAADVFVLPSLREEGLPMTLPEAMASGLPIVASRIGGIPAAVKDSETGLLVEPGNIENLASALGSLLADEKLRDQMGQSARQLAKKQFSQKAMVAGTLVVLQRAEIRNTKFETFRI